VRGSDVNGSVANFVETEQIVELDNGTLESRRWTSFLQVRTDVISISYSFLVSRLNPIVVVTETKFEVAATAVYAPPR
jgi:hypothetical protein